MSKVQGNVDLSGIKRCYIQDAEISSKCPKCGKEDPRQFADDYLSYPEIGKPSSVYFCCHHDDGVEVNWEIPMVLKSCVATIHYEDKPFNISEYKAEVE